MLQFFSSLDLSALHGLYAIRTFGGTIAMIDVSELSSATTILGLMCILLVVLAREKLYAEMTGLFIAVGGSAFALFTLKDLIHRARPDMLYWAYQDGTYSMPSGHATLVVAFYGFVAYLLCRKIRSRLWRGAIRGATAVVVLAVGFSRLYLGVHYMSDVLVGYVLGAIFLGVGMLVVRHIPHLVQWEKGGKKTLVEG